MTKRPVVAQRPLCSACTFFREEEPMYDFEQTAEDAVGFCQRHAPRIGRSDHGMAAWPIVRPNFWCGEFVAVLPDGGNA